MENYELKALLKAEKYGITSYKVVKNRMSYYSYFGNEGVYKVIHDLDTGKEVRTHLKYKKIPTHLICKCNYFCG